MKLYGYFRSSAAFRVRIALNLKRLDYESAFIHLRRGDQRQPGFLEVNPQGLVPALETDGQVLIQSLPIIEYLDERHPEPPLLPGDAAGRARVRALAAIEAWYNHWIDSGFAAFERLLSGDPSTGAFCHGDAPGLADIALVPQVVNAGRYNLDLAPYPTIVRIFENCMKLDAFAAARPERQPDQEE